MATGMTLEKLDREFQAGRIDKKKYEAMKEFISSLPTRVNGSTEENVRKYAKLAKLSESEMAEVEKLIKTLDSGVERLRTLIGKGRVEVEVTEGKHKGEKGFPLPRWFCNVQVSTAKEDAPAPAAKGKSKTPRKAKDPAAAPAAAPAAPVPAQ